MNNNLNSVIVEGTIKKIDKVENAAYFTICTKRYFKDTYGEIHEESNFFEVEAYGRIASACDSILKEETCVRVVGRLKFLRYEHNKVVIIAEHIEAKPATVENK